MNAKQVWIMVAAIVVLTVAPLFLVSAPQATDGGEAPAIFGGADDQARDAIATIAPDYEPWFSPILEPASGEIASMLFALQAALGAGVIGYWLGTVVTRDKQRKQQQDQTEAAHTAQAPAQACAPTPPHVG